MTTILPIYNDDVWSYSTTLDGVLYEIRGHWIDSDSPMCLLGLYDANGNAIEAGMRLVPGVRFAFRGRHPEAPAGILALAVTEPIGNMATRQEFIDKAALYYEPAI